LPRLTPAIHYSQISKARAGSGSAALRLFANCRRSFPIKVNARLMRFRPLKLAMKSMIFPAGLVRKFQIAGLFA
jgi:hypothetical protein